MIITAKLKYLDISPRKVRLIADMVKGLEYTKAENQLKHTPNRSASPLLKLIRSAKANAIHNFNITENSEIIVKNVIVSQGPMLKRWRPRAFGRAYTVRKRRSHVLVELECNGEVVANPKKKNTKETSTPEAIKEKSKEGSERKQTDTPNTFQRKGDVRQLSQKENTKKRFFQRKVI
jgi:large subunit ribosomal protein L22